MQHLALFLSSLLLSSCLHSRVIQPGQERVILLHGLGRSPDAMSDLSGQLSAAGFDVHNIGYHSLFRDWQDVHLEIEQKIGAVLIQGHTPTHFVGHSLGGLLIRAYLQEHQPRTLGRVVNLGSPHGGTPVVDALRERWWFRLLGPVALGLGSQPSPFLESLQRPHYPLGVIAGHHEKAEFESMLPGADDGVVPVASTRVPGMSDFLVVPVGHAALRRDLSVSQQVVHFLKFGRFFRQS